MAALHEGGEELRVRLQLGRDLADLGKLLLVVERAVPRRRFRQRAVEPGRLLGRLLRGPRLRARGGERTTRGFEADALESRRAGPCERSLVAGHEREQPGPRDIDRRELRRSL